MLLNSPMLLLVTEFYYVYVLGSNILPIYYVTKDYVVRHKYYVEEL